MSLITPLPAFPQPYGYTEEKSYLMCRAGSCRYTEVLCLCNWLLEQKLSELGWLLVQVHNPLHRPPRHSRLFLRRPPDLCFPVDAIYRSHLNWALMR